MLASVLNTTLAVQASIHVVRAFVKLREIIASHKDLRNRMRDFEEKVDKQFTLVFRIIDGMMAPPVNEEREPVGYKVGAPKRS